MKKVSSALLVVAVALVLINLINVNEEQPYSTGLILDETWDEFGLVSYQIGDTDPTIWIQMDERKSEQGLRKYLEQNLTQSDLKHYNIDIIQRDVQKMEQEHQEHLLQLRNSDN